MPRALHDESRESSFAQRPSQMRAGVVQAVHLAAHLEQGKSPPTYLHTFCTFLGDVLFRRQPNPHEIAYSPRLEKGAPRRAWAWPRVATKISIDGVIATIGQRTRGRP